MKQEYIKMDVNSVKGVLAAVQAELHVPKRQYNDFGKFSYRSCEDIMEAAKPILAKHNALVVVSDTVKDVGGRIYIEAAASFYVVGLEGSITVTASAREALERKGMDDSQITGSASSYARKYALGGLYQIDDTDDADASDKKKSGANTNKLAVTSRKPADNPSQQTIEGQSPADADDENPVSGNNPEQPADAEQTQPQKDGINELYADIVQICGELKEMYGLERASEILFDCTSYNNKGGARTVRVLEAKLNENKWKQYKWVCVRDKLRKHLNG